MSVVATLAQIIPRHPNEPPQSEPLRLWVWTDPRSCFYRELSHKTTDHRLNGYHRARSRNTGLKGQLVTNAQTTKVELHCSVKDVGVRDVLVRAA